MRNEKCLKTICIMCPIGCELEIFSQNGEVKVFNNACVRGEVYGKQEIIQPKRIVTSTVSCQKNRVAVKTSNPIPKDKIFEVMAEIDKITIKTAKNGDILVKNVLNLDSDIIVTGII